MHCYNDSGTERGSLSLSLLKKLAMELKGLGVMSFTLSGGEPLLHPEIREIITFLHQNGIEAHLVTNGSLLNDIATVFPCIHAIQVSLDGACDKTHDFIRGKKGSFDTIMSQLSALDEITLNKVTLKMVVTSRNKDEILEYIGLAKKIGVHRVSFGWLNNLGRAEGNSNLAITDLEKMHLIDQINDQIRSNDKLEIVPVGTTDLCPYVNKEGKTTINMNLRIDSDGNIFPCQLISCNKFILGNIHTINIRDLSNSQKVNALFDYAKERQNHIAKCSVCVWQTVCKGGCIGDGMTDDNLYSPDSLCDLRRMVFLENVMKKRK